MYAPVSGRLHTGAPGDDDPEQLFGPEPKRIALQACSVEFVWEGIERKFEAGAPWWRGGAE